MPCAVKGVDLIVIPPMLLGSRKKKTYCNCDSVRSWHEAQRNLPLY